MASIRREIVVETGVDAAWAALREVGEARLLFAPVLVDSGLDGDVRWVRFANGMEARERVLDVDDEHRRVSWTVEGSETLAYHHGSMQVDMAGPGRCMFIWITDFLPAEAATALTPLIEQGTQAFKRNLERRAVPGDGAAVHGAGR
jgi:hypothetical protein